MALTGTFRITEIDGAPALGDFELALDDEGRVHGRVINRFSGAVEPAEGGVVFGAIMATRMAGPPELMAQEDAVFRALAGTATASADGDDILLASDGGTLRLSPAPTEGAVDDASLV